MDLGAVSLHPHWLLASPEVVQTAHGRGLAIPILQVALAALEVHEARLGSERG